MGGTWGWGILWEGPLESGPVGCICCTLDCQVPGGCWTGQTSSDTGLTCLILKDSWSYSLCTPLPSFSPSLSPSSPSPTSLPPPLFLPLLPFSHIPLFLPHPFLPFPLFSSLSFPPSPTHLYLQVSYAIGIAKPLSIYVDTFGTSELSSSELLAVIEKNFDLRPGVIIRQAIVV